MLRFRSFQFLLKSIRNRITGVPALGHQLARHASGIVAKVLHVTSEAQRTRDVRRGKYLVPTSKRALAARQRSHQRIHVLRVGAATNIINKEPIPPPRR
ncbi:hypothetical protein KC347_g110 [Hortaea werneckii]|nr:hypothetical protein KC347_g110 [Hortaea werneckii]